MKNLKFVFAICVLFAVTTLSAQYNEDYFDVHQNTVVAVNGLKLRTKPGTKGKVIGKIPFGQNVEILDDTSYGRDTLESDYKIYYGDDEVYEPLLTGSWIKVRYDGQEGYVFSAFLYYHFDADDHLNQHTALLFEGGNCYDNLHYHPDWHWYGVYESNGVHQLRKVKLELFVEETELGPFLTIVTNQPEASLFIVGSPRPMEERRLFFSEYAGRGAGIYMGGEIDQQVLSKASLDLVAAKGENEYLQLVAVGSQGQRQILNAEELYLGSPASLTWYGDLDGDGKMDYLINYGEQSMQTILYLSSQAKEGQLVAPVGVYYDGYCC